MFCVVGAQIKQYVATRKQGLMEKGKKNTYAGLSSLLAELDISKVKARADFDENIVFSLSTEHLDRLYQADGEDAFCTENGIEVPFIRPETGQVRSYKTPGPLLF